MAPSQRSHTVAGCRSKRIQNAIIGCYGSVYDQPTVPVPLGYGFKRVEPIDSVIPYTFR